MLQQTRAETARRRFPEFLSRFPTLASLANAPLEAVLAEWQGMGYYARARNLHAAARAVLESGGKLPGTREKLLHLPGIGPYMAGAVASIAFGERAAAVDGNVLRVLSRLLNHPSPVDRPEGRAALEAAAGALVPRARPGDFNQALMELGALVCRPRKPECPRCPLREDCTARRAGTETLRPVRAGKAAPRRLTLFQLWAEAEGAVLLVRRPENGLFGGMWELPGTAEEGRIDRPDAAALGRACARLIGRGWTPGPEIARARRRLTHREILFVVLRARPPRRRRRPALRREDARWVEFSELAALPIATAQRAAIRAARAALAEPADFTPRPSMSKQFNET